jgi:hypothetical protein
LLTGRREAFWQGHIQLPTPTTVYGLPLPFTAHLPHKPLPWHHQHYQCNHENRGYELTVHSFIGTVIGDARSVVHGADGARRGRRGTTGWTGRSVPCSTLDSRQLRVLVETTEIRSCALCALYTKKQLCHFLKEFDPVVYQDGKK